MPVSVLRTKACRRPVARQRYEQDFPLTGFAMSE
jgi:hypothetical protein